MLPEIKRGNTYRFTYTHKHNELPADLTGCTVVFTVKSEESDNVANDTAAIIQTIVTEHLPQSGDTLGQTVIEVTPSETLYKKGTSVMIEKDTYHFDIKVFHADDTQFTEVEGKVKVDTAPTNNVSL